MSLSLAGHGVEIAIVTRQPEPMLAFYRDALGLAYEGRIDFPFPGGNQELGIPAGFQHRLRCGPVVLKLIASSGRPGDGIMDGAYAATGFRFITLLVNHFDEALLRLQTAGAALPLGVRPFIEGVRFAFVVDPDGNWVELTEPLAAA
jgi:catechol 2,3-dioxygenase-like lactoylglutathione lyase family enzyme